MGFAKEKTVTENLKIKLRIRRQQKYGNKKRLKFML